MAFGRHLTPQGCPFHPTDLINIGVAADHAQEAIAEKDLLIGTAVILVDLFRSLLNGTSQATDLLVVAQVDRDFCTRSLALVRFLFPQLAQSEGKQGQGVSSLRIFDHDIDKLSLNLNASQFSRFFDHLAEILAIHRC